MLVGVIGINHKTSPLEFRELLAKACHFCFGTTSWHVRWPGAVLLSTCNRTEVYFTAPNLAEAHGEILLALRGFVKEPFEHRLYSFFGADCFLHLAKVASGLDSAILAETEIQQQVKNAYQAACCRHRLSPCLHYLFQKSLKIGKQARTTFPLPRGLPTLESTLLQLVKELGYSISARTLFIGNSQINRQILAFFRAKGFLDMTLCTRSIEGATDFAQEQHVALANWSILPNWQNWDLIICASNQHEHVLKEDSGVCYQTEKSHLMIDLSVPRNLDPSFARRSSVHLFNMEQIGHLVDVRRRYHLHETGRSQELIEASVARLLKVFYEKNTRKCACAGF